MKRMIFIRIALPALLVLAAMTFMGTVSVSAQSYFSPSQASAVTEATLIQLSQAGPDKTGSANSTLVGNNNNNSAQSPVVNNNGIAQALKVAYLLEVRTNLKMGLGTQAAIDQVYTTLSANASGTRIVLLGTAKAYVVDLLSN